MYLNLSENQVLFSQRQKNFKKKKIIKATIPGDFWKNH